GLTGDPISAEEARGYGLVNDLCDEGQALDRALALAERICANAPVAVRETRRLMTELVGGDDETAMARSAEALATGLPSEDFSEGLTAFIEKRPPAWKGR